MMPLLCSILTPGEFTIDIRNVETIDSWDDRAFVRYEEWQTLPEETTGRVSTVLFATGDENTETETGVAWVHLQETWLEE